MSKVNFRKTQKINEFIKLNFSKSGVSATLGIPGLSINLGSKGAFLNLGMPGTGVYKRTKLTKKEKKDEPRQNT
jgi:hypothetical protein